MFEEKAIQLISVNQQGKYILNSEGVNFIKKIKAPIAVISVAGLYRTGKSYLLNRMLLNRSDGFGVGPTVNPCTKGLWCWGSPIKGTTQDGQKANVIIIDTQGIGALDQDQTHDTRIFTLAILLSSCFIYNSVGSIDENALQNLSLVVNLTKNIQLKTHQSQQEEQDPDEIAQFFPSFNWVVRDFSLQLVNSQGEMITPKQYLERALAPQKGFSDDIEQKNRIRRLLISYFKDRECVTLVRPLVNQSKLQHLDRLDFDELRPEFVEQVINFRKKILGKIKPKTIKGKNLDGNMFLNLSSSYIHAINQGAVPNIQNAWNYMCTEQCTRVLEDSLQLFNTQARQNFQSNFPCSEEEFNLICDRIKQVCYQNFEQKAVGQHTKVFFSELRKKVKAKIKQLRAENQRESINAHKAILLKNFSVVQKKLKLNQFKTFQQFMKGVGSFYVNLLQSGPNLPQKQVIYLDFLKKIIPQGAEIFLRNLESNIQKSKCLSQQKFKHYEMTIQNLKSDNDRQNSTMHEKSSKLMKEISQKELKIQRYEEQLQKMAIQNLKQIETFKVKLRDKQAQLEKKQLEYLSQSSLLKQKLQEVNNEINQKTKQFEKDKALQQLKIKQLHQQLEQTTFKEKNATITVNNMKSQHNMEVKDLTCKFQKRIFELQKTLKKTQQNQSQLTYTSQQLKQKIMNLGKVTEENQKKYLAQLQTKKQEITRLKSEITKTQTEMNEKVTEKEKCMNIKYEQLSNVAENYQKQNRDLGDTMKNMKAQFEKSEAILNQKVQFLQLTLRQAQQQLIQQKLSFENQVKSLEDIQKQRMLEMQNNKIQQLKEEYELKVKTLENEYEQLKKKSQTETESLNSYKLQLELELKITKNTLQTQARNYDDIVNTLEKQLKQLKQKHHFQQNKTTQSLKSQEVLYMQKIADLQFQLEQAKEDALSEQRNYHSKSQETVMQLKNYYQIEKQKLEHRLNSQREKYDRNIKNLVDDYETRLRQQTNAIEQQYQQLKFEYTSMQTTLQQTISKIQHENDIKNKNIQNLQKSNTELKEKIEKYQKQYSTKLQKSNLLYQTQKESLYGKIDQMHHKLNKLQKELLSEIHSKEQLQTTLEKKEETLRQLNEQTSTLRLKLDQAVQSNRTKINEINNQFMEKKINYEKILALAQQQRQFLQKKVKQSEKSLESVTAHHEQRMKKIKEELQNDLQNQNLKYSSEMKNLESKYEKLKRNSKETENQLLKTISTHEKERAIEQEKFLNVQAKLKQYEENKSQQAENINVKIANLKALHNKDKKALEQHLNIMKKQNTSLENQKNALISNYEKDKALWENKFVFLQQNKEKNKKQTTQIIKKLQATIQNLQKSKASDKTHYEQIHNQYVSKVQKKNWSNIQDLNENYSKKQAEFQTNIRKLQSQVRSLTQKLAYQQQNRNGNQVITQRKVKELLENEKKLLLEIEKLKNDKQNQSNQSMMLYERQRQNLKKKLTEKEQKFKTLQNNKQNLYFEFQKQKAKWNLEKESLKEKLDELKQNITKNQVELEKLQRENQKLRVQKKCSKLSLPGVTRYSNYSLQRGLSRSGFEDSFITSSMQKQNYSPLSELSLFGINEKTQQKKFD